jgi:hypothetical protein
MIIVRLLSPGPWLVGTTKVYSGVGADIVMESITLITDEQPGDRLNQRLAHGRIRRFGVLGIMEARISIGDEVEGRAYLQLQLHRLGLRRRLRMRARAGNAAVEHG